MKVHGDENLMNLRLLFKIAASAATVSSAFGGAVKSFAVWYGSTWMNRALYLFDTPVATDTGWAVFVMSYNLFIGTCILVGLWRPQYILDRIPKSAMDLITDILKKGTKMIRLV